MPRPIKPKLVKETPKVDFYKPRGIPVAQLEEAVLRIEELEALRLVDLEGLYQEDAARSMGISRQTLQRMVTEARSKLIDAIFTGKALRIKGGTYILQERSGKYRCGRCGQQVSGYGRRRRGWRCPTCD